MITSSEEVTREKMYEMIEDSPVKKFLLDNGLDYDETASTLTPEILNEYYEVVVRNQSSFDEMVIFIDILDRNQNTMRFGRDCYQHFLYKIKDPLIKQRYDSVADRCNEGSDEFQVNNGKKHILIVD